MSSGRATGVDQSGDDGDERREIRLPAHFDDRGPFEDGGVREQLATRVWRSVEIENAEVLAELREVEEETGLRCAFEDELPTTAHVDHKGRLKVVRYWVMRPIGGEATPHNEVDAVQWVPVARAGRMLTYERDRALLEALVAAVR